MLAFNKASHVYTWNGNPVPSCTGIINEWQLINVYGVEYYCNTFNGTVVSAEMFRMAAQFGTAVHYGCKIIGEAYQIEPKRVFKLRDLIEVSMLAPELHKPLEQFVEWLNQYKPKIMLIEDPLYSKRYGYAGTPDIICILNNKPIVCDIKTGMYGLAGVQMAGYEQLWGEHLPRTGRMGRYVLHIPKDGGAYKFMSVGSAQDWAFFQSRLYQWQYLQEKGRKLK
jgi:hypothetical protein